MAKSRMFMCDFETTVYEGQQDTEVWASAAVELYTENVVIFHSIGELYEFFVTLDENIIAYFHNLKFDGAFWLYYLMHDLKFEQAYGTTKESPNVPKMFTQKQMKNNTFSYVISDMGQWYTITIKVNNHFIEIRDSLKLLPFSVKKIGKDFQTKHQKLDMEYTGYRYAGCTITDEEKKYIANDVLVVKEALEIMFGQGHNSLTIGGCCLKEYKSIMAEDYTAMFPNLYEKKLDENVYGSPTVGDYIHKSYRGGWCYLVRGKECKIKKNGVTADVNSLYPSMMSKESGNKYPTGIPFFWKGNKIPCAHEDNLFWFVRIRTRFKIKPGYLPFIQIKNNIFYKPTECLETSDIRDKKTGKYYSKYTLNGVEYDTRVTMTMTMVDYKLFREHYDVKDFEILDGCWFFAEEGIFDEYIEKYKKLKMESKGALRQLAKLFLNNLYGKMASSPNSSYKLVYLKEDGSIGFTEVTANDKTPGYIPVGSAITSYARNFTIRAAQANYHGVDKPGFIYADTDSIHCDLPPEQITGIKIDPKEFCCWKLESSWDVAWFVRQKTYIEHVVAEDLEPIENPYLSIKCAGMPEKCKSLFVLSLKGRENFTKDEQERFKEMNAEEQWFVNTKRKLTDFNIGLKVPGKLLPKKVPGGILLVDTSYEMR